MKTVLVLLLVLPLLGCTSYPSPDSSVPVPSPNELETGDCHALAQEHLFESAWQETDAGDQQHVFAAMLAECQQWKTTYAWKNTGQ